MDLSCTCGERLPPRANFCPNCAKPTGALPNIEPDPPAPVESPIPVAAEEPEIGSVENIRAAIFPAGLAAFLSSIPFVGFLCFIWYPLAGFVTVFAFRRRLGATPPLRKAIGLGALTGLLSFVITLVLQAISFLMAGQGEIMEALRKQAAGFGGGDEVAKFFESPALVGAAIIVGLVIQSVAAVGFSAIGGALAARILDDEN